MNKKTHNHLMQIHIQNMKPYLRRYILSFTQYSNVFFHCEQMHPHISRCCISNFAAHPLFAFVTFTHLWGAGGTLPKISSTLFKKFKGTLMC